MVLIVLSLHVNTRVGKLRTTGGKMARASGHFLNSIKWEAGVGVGGVVLSSSAGVTVLGWQEQGAHCFRINEQVINPGITNVALVGKRSMFPLRVIYSPQHNITLWMRKKKIFGRLMHL